MVKLDRERLLSHIQGEDARVIMTRILGTVELVLRDHQLRATDFLDPYHAMLAEGILSGIAEINFKLNGGYRGAERKRIAIAPEYLQPAWKDFEMVLGEARSQGSEELTHRDYLGALLGTGVRREKVGDLLVFPGKCQFVADQAMFDYLKFNWEQVGRSTVVISCLSAEQWQELQEEAETVRISVPSLRLDAIAAQGFGLARGKLVEALKGQKLRLNWCPASSPAALVKEGDMISFKGHGRLVVAAVLGETRKGRIALEVTRFR